MARLAAFLLLCCLPCLGGELVKDEAVRLQVIRLDFPGARISVLPKQPPQKPAPVKGPMGRVIAMVGDGIRPDHEYDIVGPLAKSEQLAASDIRGSNRPPSDKRQVEMQLNHWRTAEGEFLVAVLRYSILGANPPRCCLSIGQVLLLSNRGDRILDVFEKAPHAFTTFTSVRFIRVDNTNAERLMISADFSGAGTTGISSIVFDVSHQKLMPLIAVTTMILYQDEYVYTQSLDVKRTKLAAGKRYYFVKRSYAEDAKVLQPVVKSIRSYPIGTGVPLDWP